MTPLALEKKAEKREQMSPFQQRLMDALDARPSKVEKLLLTLQDKKNYVLHYWNLQFYLEQRMQLTRVHGALEFEQERWMEPCIRMNTKLRKKAISDFEENPYKLMNNSVFGKTMENLRNRIDIRITRRDKGNKIPKLVASRLYSKHVIFTKEMVRIDIHNSRLLLNRPFYVEMTILDYSRTVMYDFYYRVLKKQYGPRCELLYTDTDSLLLCIEMDDVYKDIEENKHL